jgi:hypothetical protein
MAHKCGDDCRTFQRYAIRQMTYWGSLTAERIAEKREKWALTSPFNFPISSDYYPNQRSFEDQPNRNVDGVYEQKRLSLNLTDPMGFESNLTFLFDEGKISQSEVDIFVNGNEDEFSLAEQNSATQMEEAMYIGRRKEYKKVFDKIVKECTESQRIIIESAKKQLLGKNGEINQTKISATLGLSQQAVSKTLKRISKRVPKEKQQIPYEAFKSYKQCVRCGRLSSKLDTDRCTHKESK